MSNRKRVGIPGWIIGDKTFGAGKEYLDFAAEFGRPLILVPDEQIEPIDLLILPGGADVNPARYNCKPGMWNSAPNYMLEWFDMVMLPQYIAANTPIIGICRGLQSLAVHFGAKLQQHIFHDQSSPNEWSHAHGLAYTKGFAHHKNLCKSVTSTHHQAVDPDTLPDCLDVVAVASEWVKNKADDVRIDIPEIIVHKTLPIYMTQSHPERNPQDELTRLYANKFLEEPTMMG